MINPESLNKVHDIYPNDKMTILDVNTLAYYDKVQYDLLDDKSFKKYMTDLERSVRNSFEYRKLIKYLKNSEGMNVCSFLENVSCADNNKVKIEIHHSPFTLFDICLAVFKKRQYKKEPTDIESVAEEVIYLHYIGWVGLIPLSSTVHDLVHNQYLFVPTDRVRGFYNRFKDYYYNFISPDALDALDVAELYTKEYNNQQMELFNNHKIYVNINGSYGLPRKNDITQSIKNRINEIKSNKIIMAKIIR